MERCGQARQTETEFVGRIVEFERSSQQKPLGIGSAQTHEAQRFPIGAEQEMLAVVERMSGDVHATGASAELPGRFEDAN